MSLEERLEEPKSSRLGWNMSIGIALLCNAEQTLVMVTDSKVDFGSYSADFATNKNVPIHKEWSVLFAGNDVEHARPIIDMASSFLRANPPQDAIDVANAVDEAFAERLSIEITNKVLRKRGFTAESFVEKGKQKCTPSVYLSLCSRIDQIKISLKFLVCGFDHKGRGHIFLVDGESAPKSYDPVDMWAIGSGAFSAMSFLAFHADQGNFGKLSLERAVYLTVGAKFMAETAEGVGSKAAFVIIREHGVEGFRSVKYSDIERIRQEIWKPEGMPKLPENLEGRIGPLIVDPNKPKI
jgi:hypothetical protein